MHLSEEKQTVSLVSLVLDFTVYPRMTVDDYHVRSLKNAIYAGASLPLVVVEKNTLRVVDGFHRVGAMLSVRPSIREVEVLVREYVSEKDLFEDAVQLNAIHGKALSSYDKAHIIALSERYDIKEVDLAGAMHMTVDAVQKIVRLKLGRVKVNQTTYEATPIKLTVRHLAGKTLTQSQVEVMSQLGGMTPTFYANQLIKLIGAEMLDDTNDELFSRLECLLEALNGYLGAQRLRRAQAS